MKNELKIYDKYKETGLFWLEKIPSHWSWLYLSQVCNEQKIKNKDDLEDNVLSLSYGKIIQKKNKDFGLVPKEYNTYQIVSNGNIILRLTDLQNDKKSLRTGLVKETGIITSAYACLKTNNNPAYLHYLLNYYDLIKVFYGLGGGVRQSIGFNDIRKLQLPVPPQDEQNQIVHYLDSQLAKINKLIKAKKKQIELLKEQKQAIINQAVTKGLDPNAKMKPSGVEWLREIPEDWVIKKLSHIAKITLSGLDKKMYENQRLVYLCNYVDVYRNDFITNNFKFMQATASESEVMNLKLKIGDLIITKDSESWDDIGVPAIIIEDLVNVCCGYHLAIIRCMSEEINSKFLFYSFKSQYLTIQHKLKAKGVTRFALGYQPIHDTVLCIPPLTKQVQIVHSIEQRIQSIDRTIEVIQSEINLLSEYRPSLISEVVTGKIDVRGVAVEEVNEPELDEEFELDEEVEMEDFPESEE